MAVNGKNAIVVGASSGIGRELARILAGEGFRVGITGRRTVLLDELKNEMPDLYEVSVFDAAETDAPKYLEELVLRMGGTDMIVLCSGTGFLNPSLAEAPEVETVALNVAGFTRIAGFAYRYFAERGGGHFVAVTSVMGLRGSGTAPAYAASKAYQIGYMEGLRQRAAKQNAKIYITDVRPGSVDTDMMKGEGHFWIASPKRAAACIRRAIGRRRCVAYITPRWGVIALLLKTIPRSLYRKL